MNNIFFSLREHAEIDDICLNDINHLKDSIWHYGIDRQSSWIQDNICSQDIHVLGYNDSELVAYANLVKRQVSVDSIRAIDVWGIGNVCVSAKGTGRGRLLMKFINQFIFETNSVGTLLCKSSLVEFYGKNGWILQDTTLSYSIKSNISFMTLNFPPISYRNLEIIGKLF